MPQTKKLSPRVCEEDWVPCPTCHGQGHIATQTSWAQGQDYRNKPGKLLCPTCGDAKVVLAPVCPACRHCPSVCVCRLRCAVCGEPTGQAAWFAPSRELVPRCALHMGFDTLPSTWHQIVPASRGGLTLLRNALVYGDLSRKNQSPPPTPRKK